MLYKSGTLKVIAIIPARYAASRFPGKLMQKLGGKTVIAMTYDNVVNTGLFDDVMVATDSEEIYNEVVKSGGHAVMTGAHETGSDRIAEVVRNLSCHVVLNVQGDEPFIQCGPLSDLINVFKNDPEHEIALASLKIRLKGKEDIENPNHVKVVTDRDGLALYFSRAVIPYHRETNLEAEYFRHIGVYAFRREALLQFSEMKMTPLEQIEKIEAIRYLENGLKIKMIETDFIGVGIDVPEDLEKARKLLRKQQ